MKLLTYATLLFLTLTSCQTSMYRMRNNNPDDPVSVTRWILNIGGKMDMDSVEFIWHWNADGSGWIETKKVTEGMSAVESFKSGVASAGGVITSGINSLAPGINQALRNRSAPRIEAGPLRIPAGEAESILRELRSNGATVTELPPPE